MATGRCTALNVSANGDQLFLQAYVWGHKPSPGRKVQAKVRAGGKWLVATFQLLVNSLTCLLFN
jgi:hypothetical protein